MATARPSLAHGGDVAQHRPDPEQLFPQRGAGLGQEADLQKELAPMLDTPAEQALYGEIAELQKAYKAVYLKMMDLKSPASRMRPATC
jgi:hypothetical protein